MLSPFPNGVLADKTPLPELSRFCHIKPQRAGSGEKPGNTGLARPIKVVISFKKEYNITDIAG